MKDEITKLSQMSKEKAMLATVQQIEKGCRPGDRLLIEKWEAAQEIKFWHQKLCKGEKKAIIESLYLCVLNDFLVPSWLTLAFLRAYRDVNHYRAASWDEVFGPPHRKGIHLKAKKDEKDKSVRVWVRVKQIQKTKGEPIDEFLFESIGKEFGICRSLASKHYYSLEKRLNPMK